MCSAVIPTEYKAEHTHTQQQQQQQQKTERHVIELITIGRHEEEK